MTTAVTTQKGTVSQRLAEHVVGTRFADLPPAVVERAKDSLIFHVSRAFAERFEENGRAAVRLAQRLSGGSTDAPIIGHRERAATLDAIFAHSELLGDLHDKHLPSKVFVARVAEPVAWVLGEQEHVSGRELITALVVAYDAACKLAEPVLMAGDYARMPNKCAFGPFAPAAISARFLRQDARRAAQTLALAAHYGMGNNEGYGYAHVFSLIARNGVMAALLPGFTAAETYGSIESPYGLYAALFGGPPEGLEPSLASLGRDFSIMGLLVRGATGGSHLAPLQVGEALIARLALQADAVERVTATLPDEFRGRFGKRETAIQRDQPTLPDLQQSLRLQLAILLVERTVREPTFDHYANPIVRAAMDRIEFAFEVRPVDWAAIELRTRDGRVFREEGRIRVAPKGDWSAWLRQDGERFLSEAKLTKLEQLLTHLEDVNDVAEVLACTVPDRDEVSATTA